MPKLPSSVAVIGCGIAGVSLARLITRHCPHARVTLFDKARGMGGRMATRYSDETEFDHGAQFFTVRDPAFEQFLAPYRTSFESWDAAITTLSPGAKTYKRIWFEPHYVGTPRMSSLCRHIANGIDAHLGQKIHRISGLPGRWYLESDTIYAGPFDWVISTAPAPQTADILNVKLEGVTYEPTFALLASLTKSPGFDAAVVKDSPICWLASSASKPKRCELKNPGLVVHAASDWSSQHIDEPREVVRQKLLDALGDLPVEGIEQGNASLHLWRFAKVTRDSEHGFFLDQQKQIAACGDWAAGQRVEDAFLSADELFSAIRCQL